MSARLGAELGSFILRSEAIKLYRSFLRVARQAPGGSQADVRAEVRREFEAARAASQRRKERRTQQAAAEQPPPPPPAERPVAAAAPAAGGGGAAAAGSPARARRRLPPLPPPASAAPGGDEDAYATKKALSDGREALKRLREMIELRR